jgi:hypothetical protein
VPAKKRKVTYPTPRTATRSAPPAGAGGDPAYVRASLVAIDVTAGAGRKGLSVGDRVLIIGTGLYAGEIAVIEQLTGGVVPAARVRTEAGRTRQARTIDLEPVAGSASE